MSRRKKILNQSDIPQRVIDSIAHCIWPDILAYYESEEGAVKSYAQICLQTLAE